MLSKSRVDRVSAAPGGAVPDADLAEATFEGINDAVFAVSRQTRQVMLCNRAVMRVFGHEPTEVKGRTTEFLHVDHDHFRRFGEASERVLSEGRPYRVEYPMRRKGGDIFIADITVTPIGRAGDAYEGVVSVVRDMTKDRSTDELLRATTAALEERVKELKYLNSVSRAPEDPSVGVDGFLTKVVTLLPSALRSPSASFARITVGSHAYESVPFRAAGQRYMQAIESARDGAIGEIEVFVEATKADAEDAPLLPEEHEMLRVLAAHCAETIANARAREEIAAREVQLAALFTGADDGMFIVDDQWRIVDVNPAGCRLLASERRDLLGARFSRFVADDDENHAGTSLIGRKWAAMVSSGSLRTELILIDGNDRRIDAEVSAVANFMPNRHLGVVRDMTEHKRTETRLAEAVSEREALLQEVHHRVKNNLQIIVSMLRMQAMHAQSEACVEHLKEAESRVRSMGLVHEHLYADRNLTGIDLDRYLRNLLSWLTELYRARHLDIAVATDAIRLGLEQAIPCGLLVTELVSNAIKHAFRGRDRGRLSVEATIGPQRRVHLLIADDGPGLPDGFDYRSSGTLGGSLVVSAAQQLDALIEVDSGNDGTAVRFSFPYSVPKVRSHDLPQG